MVRLITKGIRKDENGNLGCCVDRHGRVYCEWFVHGHPFCNSGCEWIDLLQRGTDPTLSAEGHEGGGEEE